MADGVPFFFTTLTGPLAATSCPTASGSLKRKRHPLLPSPSRVANQEAADRAGSTYGRCGRLRQPIAPVPRAAAP